MVIGHVSVIQSVQTFKACECRKIREISSDFWAEDILYDIICQKLGQKIDNFHVDQLPLLTYSILAHSNALWPEI